MAQFMGFALTNKFTETNSQAEMKALMSSPAGSWINGISNIFGLQDLPQFSFRKVGINVAIQDVDFVYEGHESDYAAAEKRHGQIVKLLRPYKGTLAQRTSD